MNCESCKSMHCSLHSDEIEDYSMKICESIELAAKDGMSMCALIRKKVSFGMVYGGLQELQTMVII